ncbi:MAG: hypothetical protein K2F91_03945 [Muribaculaceae bacterium]|nr:hypothetical protein [Muribaculaceae bacterium]
MKNLYSAIALALVASGASAQSLYFMGSGEGLSWGPGENLEVKLADGAYTVEIKALSEFKVSTAPTVEGENGWDAFNAGALEGKDKGTANEANLGKPVELVLGGSNNGVPWKGDYKIVITEDLKTITLTTDTPKPVGFAKAFLRGDMNEWGTTWEMTTEDGKTYWFDCTGDKVIPQGTNFKIGDEDWGAINYSAGDEVVPIDEYIKWNYGDTRNSVMGCDEEAYEGTVLLNLVNGTREAAQVIFFTEIVEHVAPEFIPEEGGVEMVTVDNNAPKVYYNLQGVRVANPENGLYIVRQGSKTSKVYVK